MIELILVIVFIAIIGTFSTRFFTQQLEKNYFESTLEEMKQIKSALIGSSKLDSTGRKAFRGYIGDMGALPNLTQGLSVLHTNPSANSWVFNNSSLIGTGWQGPYLSADFVNSSELTKDSWGSSYIISYSGKDFRMKSLGADNVTGGSGFDQDIIMNIPEEEYLSTVQGIITFEDRVYDKAADVILYEPNGLSASITEHTDSLVAADNGHFNFSSISHGARSIKIFIPNKTTPNFVVGPFVYEISKNQSVIKLDISSQ